MMRIAGRAAGVGPTMFRKIVAAFRRELSRERASRAGYRAGFNALTFAAPDGLSDVDAAVWRNAYRVAWFDQVAAGEFPYCFLGGYE